MLHSPQSESLQSMQKFVHDFTSDLGEDAPSAKARKLTARHLRSEGQVAASQATVGSLPVDAPASVRRAMAWARETSCGSSSGRFLAVRESRRKARKESRRSNR